MTIPNSEMFFIHPDKLRETFYEILVKRNVSPKKAAICADVFTENSVDGVLSHGVNRFHRFVTLIDKRVLDPSTEPTCVKAIGALEQWHGHCGLGITNALNSTERVMTLATAHGLGCVALAYTNHWMRAGTYARHAALKGFAFIAWSNTIRNTPAWGAIDPRLGNNPLTIGIPNGEAPVVLDMAMSQFSYGALENYKIQNKTLPVYGGYDFEGNLTNDAAEIIDSRRTLPIGHWKGAGLSMLLDMLSAILSGGLSVSEISKQDDEKNLSQIFIAFDLKQLSNFSSMHSTLDYILTDLKQSSLEKGATSVRYPGEQIQSTRAKSFADGVRVHVKKWEEILSLR